MTKIETARAEYMEWSRSIGIDSLEKLNETLDAGKAIELINLCEARQERQYARAADRIFCKRGSCRIVMMGDFTYGNGRMCPVCFPVVGCVGGADRPYGEQPFR